MLAQLRDRVETNPFLATLRPGLVMAGRCYRRSMRTNFLRPGSILGQPTTGCWRGTRQLVARLVATTRMCGERFVDSLGISAIVLVSLDVRLHRGRTHQACRMPKRLELARRARSNAGAANDNSPAAARMRAPVRSRRDWVAADAARVRLWQWSTRFRERDAVLCPAILTPPCMTIRRQLTGETVKSTDAAHSADHLGSGPNLRLLVLV